MANEFEDRFAPPSPRETWAGKLFTKGPSPEVGGTGRRLELESSRHS